MFSCPLVLYMNYLYVHFMGHGVRVFYKPSAMKSFMKYPENHPQWRKRPENFFSLKAIILSEF